MTQFEADRMMSDVTGVVSSDALWKKQFAKTDVVVEAVFESLELKHKVCPHPTLTHVLTRHVMSRR